MRRTVGVSCVSAVGVGLGIADGMVVRAMSGSSCLTELDVSRNPLEPTGLIALVCSLEGLRVLRSLRVNNCGDGGVELTAAEATALGAAFSRVPGLRVLSFRRTAQRGQAALETTRERGGGRRPAEQVESVESFVEAAKSGADRQLPEGSRAARTSQMGGTESNTRSPVCVLLSVLECEELRCLDLSGHTLDSVACDLLASIAVQRSPFLYHVSIGSGSVTDRGLARFVAGLGELAKSAAEASASQGVGATGTTTGCAPSSPSRGTHCVGQLSAVCGCCPALRCVDLSYEDSSIQPSISSATLTRLAEAGCCAPIHVVS